MTLPDPPILVITDRRRCAEPLEDRAESLFRGGCRWLSLRENDLAPAERRSLLLRLREIAVGFGATVMVHRDLGAASACGIGLHLPAGACAEDARRVLGASVLIGQSCHDGAEMARATGVDYVTVSPAFDTPSKPGYGPGLGLGGLTKLAAGPVPVLALGGVGPANVAHLRKTGIAGVAVMGAAMAAADPEAWFGAMTANWAG